MSVADAGIPVGEIDRLFRKHRVRVMLAITLGYGFIYTCRLGLSIVKKPLIDNGIFTVEELGLIGAALLYGYAFGKFFNGFLSDHFRPRVFFTAAIFISAVINLFMGFSTLVWLSVVLWVLNGWFQGMAAPSAVISITNWFSIHERGRRYAFHRRRTHLLCHRSGGCSVRLAIRFHLAGPDMPRRFNVGIHDAERLPGIDRAADHT